MEAKMKNNNPSTPLHFHGLFTKVPDTFTFEFDTIDKQNLKLFPSTLKDATLHWFMSLEGGSITSCGKMKLTFNTKYRDYCRAIDIRDTIFRMTQGDDESLEYFKE